VSNRPEVVEGRRRHLLTAACTLGGVVLFTRRPAHWPPTSRGTNAFAGVFGRPPVRAPVAIRATSWRLCPGTNLTFCHALSAYLAGDAIGSVTPLGLVASEPTKVFLTRHHLATREAVASLAVENLIYAASGMRWWPSTTVS
jgi:hypothetical protein